MKTISITIDPELLRALDRAAKSSNRTRSELFRDALGEWIASKRRRQLADADRAAYVSQPVVADEFEGLMTAQPFDDEAFT